MPIYEYSCGKCQQRVEVFQRQRRETDGLSPPCPRCGARALRAMFSRFAVSVDLDWGNFEEMSELDVDDPEAMEAYSKRVAEQTGNPFPDGFTEGLGGDFDDEMLDEG